MVDENKKRTKQEQKEKVRRRMNVTVNPDNYEFIPAKKQVDYYDNDTPQRVGIYVRVSTDDIRQTTSYELQKKYYEDFVRHHPNWTLVKIYADEGISGTSLKHRDAFNAMIADAKAGKIDLIITKSVSRFARNVMITVGMARDLSHLKPPVGIFFESECIFSLKDESQMALTFQATMAEEESHTRSRSMETSLRMRLDNGIPLTPKLLGYTHDADGNLVINPEEAKTVKLAFYMYLYGYSAAHILHAVASYLIMERMATLQEDKLAVKLDHFLSGHYTEKINAGELAKLLGIGKTQLYELSKQLYGCGIAEHVRALRMDLAKTLMKDHREMSLSDISSQCGYHDYNYFITVFSREIGVSPSVWKEQKLK